MEGSIDEIKEIACGLKAMKGTLRTRIFPHFPTGHQGVTENHQRFAIRTYMNSVSQQGLLAFRPPCAQIRDAVVAMVVAQRSTGTDASPTQQSCNPKIAIQGILARLE